MRLSDTGGSGHFTAGRHNRRDGGKGGRRKGGHGKFYGAMGGYRGVPYKRAAGIVNSQIRRAINDLQREAQQSRNLYQQSKGDLRHIFGEVSEQIGSSNRNIADLYSGAMGSGQEATSDLLAGQSAQTEAAKAAASAELARLGIQGSGNLGRMDADALFASQMAQQAGANNQANLGLASSMAGDVGQLLAGMASGSHLSNRGQALNTRNNSLTDLRSQMGDIRQERGPMINELLESMLQSDFQRWMGIQGLQMDRRQLNASIAAQRAAANGGSGSGSGYSTAGVDVPAGFVPVKVNPNKHKPGAVVKNPFAGFSDFFSGFNF